MIFIIAYIVAYISQFVTGKPGTVVITETSSGVGDRQTLPRFLKPGDTVTVKVEKLGMLSNPVQARNWGLHEGGRPVDPTVAFGLGLIRTG